MLIKHIYTKNKNKNKTVLSGKQYILKTILNKLI